MTNCPQCKTAEHVRASRGHHTWDDTMRRVGLYPFRCDACRTRFYRFAKAAAGVYHTSQPAQRKSA